MKLSYSAIEELAHSVFAKLSDGQEGGIDVLPIETIATKHLKLTISYLKLSDNGKILGLTTYADTSCRLKVNGGERIINLRSKQVLLDEMFISPNNKDKLFGKYKFTLAHEVAHQILFALESNADKAKHARMYSTRAAYSLRELKSKEDWNEWQANALGAALLMPQSKVDLMMWYLNCGAPLTNYEGFFVRKEKIVLYCFCKHFCVSKTAGIIRLRKLGYIVDKLYSEYSGARVVAYEDI